MLDILGGICSTIPWLYRGWFWIFSKNYRVSVRQEYERIGPIAAPIDALVSIIFFACEIWFLIYGCIMLLENVR